MIDSDALVRSLRWFAAMTLLSLVVTGCGGGDVYSVEEGRIAQQFLPSERVVDYHPDSLRALTVTEDDEKIQFELDGDLESLTRKWSCTFRNMGAGRNRSTPSYATFWSLELSLATLQPEMGILTLRKEKAQDLIKERKEEYYNTIQIDVYWFVERGGDGIVTGPGARTRLRIADSTYRPTRERHSPLREAFLSGGSALYRRNTFVFSRTVNGRDILEDASGMRLEIRRMGSGGNDRFVWRWGEEQAARQENGREADRQSTALAAPRPRR